MSKRMLIVGNTKSGGQRSSIISVYGICSSLTATDYKQPKQIVVRDDEDKTSNSKRV